MQTLYPKIALIAVLCVFWTACDTPKPHKAPTTAPIPELAGLLGASHSDALQRIRSLWSETTTTPGAFVRIRWDGHPFVRETILFNDLRTRHVESVVVKFHTTFADKVLRDALCMHITPKPCVFPAAPKDTTRHTQGHVAWKMRFADHHNRATLTLEYAALSTETSEPQ